MAAPKGNKNAVGGKGGQPTKYKPEYCKKVIEWGKEGKSRTWIAAKLDTSRETLDNWAKAHVDFFDALTRAKAYEQMWWEDAGQSGMISDKFNSGVWSKSMAARFSQEWRDNSKVEVAGDPQKPLRHEHAVRWMTEEEAKARGWA